MMDRLDRQYTNQDTVRLNLGCGPVQPAGWINVDSSRRAKLASKAAWCDRLLTQTGVLAATEFNESTQTYDLRKRLPFSDSSVDSIYAGELWEHLQPADAVALTRECFRVLRPAGVIRVCVPDGEEFWRDYLKKLDHEKSKPAQERSAAVLRDHVQMYFRDICTRKSLLKSFGHFHKWQYDEIQLTDHFQQCGFSPVERRAFHDSRIEGIEEVERSDFLIVEAVRP